MEVAWGGVESAWRLSVAAFRRRGGGIAAECNGVEAACQWVRHGVGVGAALRRRGGGVEAAWRRRCG